MELSFSFRTYGSELERVLRLQVESRQLQWTEAVERLEESRLCGMSYRAYRTAKAEARQYWLGEVKSLNKAIRAEVRRLEKEERDATS